MNKRGGFTDGDKSIILTGKFRRQFVNPQLAKTCALLLLVSLTATGAAVRKTVLREGLTLAAAEGVCRRDSDQGNQRWTFYPSSAITDGKISLPAESGLEVLPSAGLEQICSFARDNTSIPVKVWAVVTAYRDKNFVFVLHVVPLTITPQPVQSRQEKTEIVPAVPDPNSSPVIPEEMLKLLRPAGRVDLASIAQSASPKGDSTIAGKTGLISNLYGAVVFTPDGFGKNIETDFYRLLPCRTLQYAQDRLGRSFGRQRYNVSGIVAVCRGQRYLLLYRAERTFTNGNFTP